MNNHDPDIKRIIRDAITKVALQESVTPDVAVIIGRRAIDEITSHYGGQRIYMPSATRDLRNKQIRQEWTGRNASDLCCKFRMSTSTLYRILKQND